MNWTSWFTGLWTALLSVILALFSIGGAGCAANTEAIERAKTDAMTTLVQPAVKQGLEQLGQRSAQLQGQGSLINPGYRTSGFGGVGTFFVWDARVNLEGASANIAGATQADQGPDVKTTEPTAPTAGGPAQLGKSEDPTTPVG
jgi:hypothetical protein